MSSSAEEIFFLQRERGREREGGLIADQKALLPMFGSLFDHSLGSSRLRSDQHLQQVCCKIKAKNAKTEITQMEAGGGAPH